MIILGISGRAGVGKDTAADYLVANYDFVKISFADVMKRICFDVFDFTEDQLWGISANRNIVLSQYQEDDLSPRKALQALGDWGRNLYPNTWIEYALKIAKELNTNSNYIYSSKKGLESCSTGAQGPKNVVIADARYLNEVNAIKDYDGIVVRLLRPQAAALAGAAGNHSSERDQKLMKDEDFDAVLDNSDAIADLYLRLDQFIRPII